MEPLPSWSIELIYRYRSIVLRGPFLFPRGWHVRSIQPVGLRMLLGVRQMVQSTTTSQDARIGDFVMDWEDELTELRY